jgi:putative chitinase
MKISEIARIPQSDLGDWGEEGTIEPPKEQVEKKPLPGGSGFTYAVNKNSSGNLEIMIFDGETLAAELDLFETQDPLNTWGVDTIVVARPYRGRGLGKALYGIALSILKLTLEAGQTQTKHGQQMWLMLNSIPGVEVLGYAMDPTNEYRPRRGDQLVSQNSTWTRYTFPVVPGQRSMRSTRRGTGIYSSNRVSMVARWHGTNESLEEGWKETLAALGMGAAALGGVAVDDYINRDATPQDVHQVVQVPDTIRKPVAPTAQAEPVKMDVKKSDIKTLPPEKLLTVVAKASGIVGNELAQLLAQAAHETLNFTHMAEIGNSKYFAKKYDPKFAPKKAKVLGNTEVGDGERFKGRGFLQITGRYNYAQAGKALGLPLEQHPELLERPDVAAKAAVWYWNHRVAPKVGDFSSKKAVKQVTKAINPGMKHMKQRQEKLAQYKSKTKKT